MLSSATCPCWTYELLRKPTSQHPHEQGPKSILEPGCRLTSTEVPACPQGGTSNNQFGAAASSPCSIALPTLFLENPGPPRYCPHSHVTFAHLHLGRPASHRLWLCPLQGPGLLPTDSSLRSQAKVWLSLPHFIGTHQGGERACKSHSQGREHLWLPSVLRPIRGAGIVVEGGTTLQNQRC